MRGLYDGLMSQRQINPLLSCVLVHIPLSCTGYTNIAFAPGIPFTWATETWRRLCWGLLCFTENGIARGSGVHLGGDLWTESYSAYCPLILHTCIWRSDRMAGWLLPCVTCLPSMYSRSVTARAFLCWVQYVSAQARALLYQTLCFFRFGMQLRGS